MPGTMLPLKILQLFLVGQPALGITLVVDDVAVDGVDHLLQLEARPHIVLVHDEGTRAGHHTAQDHLLDGLDAKLGAVHLFLDVVDPVLHELQPHTIGGAGIEARLGSGSNGSAWLNWCAGHGGGGRRRLGGTGRPCGRRMGHPDDTGQCERNQGAMQHGKSSLE